MPTLGPRQTPRPSAALPPEAPPPQSTAHRPPPTIHHPPPAAHRPPPTAHRPQPAAQPAARSPQRLGPCAPALVCCAQLKSTFGPKSNPNPNPNQNANPNPNPNPNPNQFKTSTGTLWPAKNDGRVVVRTMLATLATLHLLGSKYGRLVLRTVRATLAILHFSLEVSMAASWCALHLLHLPMHTCHDRAHEHGHTLTTTVATLTMTTGP